MCVPVGVRDCVYMWVCDVHMHADMTMCCMLLYAYVNTCTCIMCCYIIYLCMQSYIGIVIINSVVIFNSITTNSNICW